MTIGPGRTWDATRVLEALGASESALWYWDPDHDRLRLTGALDALGLSVLGPQCSSAELIALARPEDRHGVDDLLALREPGAKVAAEFRARGAGACVWRGEWLEEGVRAAGVVSSARRVSEGQLDALTGILDRRGFIALAGERLETPDGEKILVVANVNRFRRLNEALGHDRGDMVLAALAARLAAAFPAETVMGRVGDDEFAVLTEAQDGQAVGILRTALEQPLRIAGFDIFPTLSIGAARADSGREAPSAGDLLNRAVDSARPPGVGHAAVGADGLGNRGLSRLELESDLHGAVERGEIEPFFQPIVRLATGELAGFEALARWRHRRRGLLAPDEFLGLMGEMGMMPQLGAHLTRAAARQLAAWRGSHPAIAGLTVSVNLSTAELDREGLIEEVTAIVREFNLPPGALKLELTESDIMRDPESAAVILRALRDAGAGLALDDFGTGFSSLSYLTRLPFDTLKIDRYFVRTMATNEGSAKIVRSVVELGRALSLEVVAEGVEDAIMARDLMALGCDYGQGFGYSPALSADEAEVYLNESYADGAAPLKATS
jgi:c-di-GMP-specific phosphodiesterase